MYEVVVLKQGYSVKESPGLQKACGSITLLKGAHNVIVDTGNPWDKDLILQELKKNGLAPDKIEYVVCTHGHSDHVGNLNLFPHSVHIVSFDICIEDQYTSHDFNQGIPYEIDDDIEVIPTPGHTGSDVSVVVRNTDLGTVAITGDLFECCEDLENPSLWQDNSEKPEIQEQSRIDVLKMADYIVPGHGKMFKVPDDYKTQMKVVMYYEYSEQIQDDGSIMTTTDYCVLEEN